MNLCISEARALMEICPHLFSFLKLSIKTKALIFDKTILLGDWMIVLGNQG